MLRIRTLGNNVLLPMAINALGEIYHCELDNLYNIPIILLFLLFSKSSDWWEKGQFWIHRILPEPTKKKELYNGVQVNRKTFQSVGATLLYSSYSTFWSTDPNISMYSTNISTYLKETFSQKLWFYKTQQQNRLHLFACFVSLSTTNFNCSGGRLYLFSLRTRLSYY